MNSATFRIQIPDTFVGNGAVDNIGALVKQLGGKKALIVTDTGIVQAGLLDNQGEIQYGLFIAEVFQVVRQLVTFSKEFGGLVEEILADHRLQLIPPMH